MAIFSILFSPILISYGDSSIILIYQNADFVPTDYESGNGMFGMTKVKGGCPYGAGTFATPAERVLTQAELEQTFFQGKNIAIIAKKMKQF